MLLQFLIKLTNIAFSLLLSIFEATANLILGRGVAVVFIIDVNILRMKHCFEIKDKVLGLIYIHRFHFFPTLSNEQHKETYSEIK